MGYFFFPDHILTELYKWQINFFSCWKFLQMGTFSSQNKTNKKIMSSEDSAAYPCPN